MDDCHCQATLASEPRITQPDLQAQTTLLEHGAVGVEKQPWVGGHVYTVSSFADYIYTTHSVTSVLRADGMTLYGTVAANPAAGACAAAATPRRRGTTPSRRSRG